MMTAENDNDKNHRFDSEYTSPQDQSQQPSSSSSLHLRWSRLVKTVQLSDEGSGLLRTSIAASAVAGSSKNLKSKSISSKSLQVSNNGRSSGAANTNANNNTLSTPPTPSNIKTILNQVSGSAAPGQVLALMGPSGSGKTSLLNSLSGRTQYDHGMITINGQPLTNQMKKRLMTKIAYVKQADIFFSHLSVRDQLTYTALLRLPQAWTTEQKVGEVNKILQLLRLESVADSEIRYLSGGEKKRTNIGTELLTDPSVLLLDEPTSGLDSTSAVALMQLLQTLASHHNKTVITSIHQPSSKVFFSFDKLMLLAEGNAVYFGTPSDSLVYLRNLNMACPDGYNAADHWMDLLVTQNNSPPSTLTNDSDTPNTTILETADMMDPSTTTNLSNGIEQPDAAEKEAETEEETGYKPSNQRLIEAWDMDAIAKQVDKEASEQLAYAVQHGIRDSTLSVLQTGRSSTTIGAAIGKRSSTATNTSTTSATTDEMNSTKKISKYNTSWVMQYRILVHRALKNSRSAIFTPLNMIKSAALGIMVGLLYFQMPYTESAVFDRNSFFFFAMTYWVFDAMFNSLMAFPIEREVILKERSSGAYHLSAYFMAKTTSEMPMRMALPAIYMTISFWLAGISPSFSLFIQTTLISLLSVIAGESIGLMIGASIYDMEKAMTTMTVASLGLMLLGGFFIENVPIWLDWGKYVSPFKYSFDASRQLVFDRDVPCDGSGALESLCNGLDTGVATAEEVVAFLGVQGSVAFNALLLLAIGLVPRYIAYMALRAKKENDR